MSWASMASEIVGQAPGIDFQFALTLVNRAWVNLQQKFIWSFLWGDAAVPTAVPVATGTVTLQIGNSVIVGDANATTAWNSMGLTIPITVRQFRVGQGTIYNILSLDNSTYAPFAAITLDKPYVDPLQGAGNSYVISQYYFNAPTPDFMWWESMKDPVSGYDFITTFTREWVDGEDPQRYQAGWPNGPIPYLVNPWPGNFLGYPMYELWPSPVSGYTYVGTYFRKGMPFVNYSDTVNQPLGEDVVIALAKQYAYEWCLANIDRVRKITPKSEGAFQFLIGEAKRQYDGLISDYILTDESFSHRHIIESPQMGYVANLPWVSQRTGYMYAP